MKEFIHNIIFEKKYNFSSIIKDRVFRFLKEKKNQELFFNQKNESIK